MNMYWRYIQREIIISLYLNLDKKFSDESDFYCGSFYYLIFLCLFIYLSLNHEVSLVSHVENKVEDVHLFLVFDHLHHGLDGDQCPSSANTSTVKIVICHYDSVFTGTPIFLSHNTILLLKFGPFNYLAPFTE